MQVFFINEKYSIRQIFNCRLDIKAVNEKKLFEVSRKIRLEEKFC